MTSILLDTNIVLDVLLEREEWLADSEAVWSLVEKGRVRGYLAAHSFTTVAYLARKHSADDPGRILRGLLKVFRVAAVDDKVLRRAVELGWSDFEDAVVSEAALAAGCEYIVTRNCRDFARSPLLALTPVVACLRFLPH